jgi:hypothetical protein
MTKSIRAPRTDRQAKRVARQSQERHALSPRIEDELRHALSLCQGTEKAEAVAWRFGWDRSTYYRRLHEPMDMSVADLLHLLAACPDPKLNARLRGHLAALDTYQAFAEAEAGESFVRVRNRITFGQPLLPLKAGDR